MTVLFSSANEVTMGPRSEANCLLSAIGSELAKHSTFGDFASILDRALSIPRNSLDILACRNLSFQKVLAQYESLTSECQVGLLQDPVFRSAVFEALQAITRAGDDAVPNLSHSIDGIGSALDDMSSQEPLVGRCAAKTGNGVAQLIVWNEEFEDTWWNDCFQRLFHEEIASSVSSQPVVTRSPSEDELTILKDGHRLLLELLPELGSSTLAHVKLLSIIDYEREANRFGRIRTDLCQNVSTHNIPGTIFLSPSPLRSSWQAAEALLHEATHKKLSDLVATRSIFCNGYSDADAPVIQALWNRPISWNSNAWSVDRALFAFHVYVHLAVFFGALESHMLVKRTDEFDEIQVFRDRKQASIDRAVYLGNELQSTGWSSLGHDGQELVRWLSSLCKQLHKFATPNLAISLLMDRYDAETDRLERIVSSAPRTSLDLPLGNGLAYTLGEELSHLVHSELVSVYRVFSVLGERDAPQLPFYDADSWVRRLQMPADPAEVARWLSALRRMASVALRNAPEDAASLPCKTRRDKTLIDLVNDLVEHIDRHDLAFARMQELSKNH